MKTPIRVLGLLGIFLIVLSLVFAFKQYGPNGLSGVFDSVYDGQTVQCNVAVDAQTFGQPLRITSASCVDRNDACIINPAKAYSVFGIGDVEGSIALWQSGELYDTEAVKVNVFSTASKVYVLSGCVPEDATAVRVGVLNSEGGVLNDQTYQIQ